MDELEKVENAAVAEIEQEDAPLDGRVLYITPESKHVDYRALLGKVVQCVNMGDVLSKIKAGTQYVVRVPIEFQKALDNGELFMMRNERTGVTWPTLMRIAENGKHQVVKPLSIVEQPLLQGNPIQDFAAGYNNLLMQQQLERLSVKLDTVLEAATRIEEGQMDDRLAKFCAGKDGLILALSVKDEDTRLQQINASRTVLTIAQAEIGRALKSRVDRFAAIPIGAHRLYACEVNKTGYLREKDKDFHLIQEYYDYYLKATKFIAISFAMCNELDAAEQSYAMAEEFLAGIDFSNVKTIEHMHKNLPELFCEEPVRYLLAERELFLEETKAYDFVSIEVSGSDLQEVLSCGTQEAISENCIEQRRL